MATKAKRTKRTKRTERAVDLLDARVRGLTRQHWDLAERVDKLEAARTVPQTATSEAAVAALLDALEVPERDRSKWDQQKALAVVCRLRRLAVDIASARAANAYVRAKHIARHIAFGEEHPMGPEVEFPFAAGSTSP